MDSELEKINIHLEEQIEEQTFEYINQVLSFYKSKLSIGFDNNIFKESNSEQMIFARLERAAKNEACNDLLHSRYAIWASDVIELIEDANKVLINSDSFEALRRLNIALNTVKAYKDIQTVFENGSFHKVSEIFKAYAVHLLAVDDSKSKIIKREKIIEFLKERSKVSGVGLPRDIDFSIKNDVLRIFIKNVIQNMQVDGAAFEGWILILKAWMPGEINYVELDFEVPEHLVGQYGNPEICHYNRFLYRLYNMTRIFPNWFFLSKSKLKKVSDFMSWIKTSNCLLNHSLHERESVIKTEKMERQIESWFAFEEGKSMLCKHWHINESKLFNQLPIGVFYNEIASKNAIFTRGASAIDLWGIGDDGQTLHIVELKCGANKGIGVISEMLFYTAVIYDSCIANNRSFSFGKYGKYAETKDTAALKNCGNKFTQLFAHILAEQYHPLFNTEVEKLICKGLVNLDVSFDRAKYDYSKQVLFNENNNL